MDIADDPIPIELFGRDVDRYGEPVALVVPRRTLSARILKDPGTDRDDQAAGFQCRNEVVWLDDAPFRMAPTQQLSAFKYFPSD